MILTKNEIQHQSVSAWNTWRTKWVKNCKVNKEIKSVSLASIIDYAKGWPLIQCAFGYSLSGNLEIVKSYRGKVKVMCCDKAFGYLGKNDIHPDYCIIADASVTTEWYDGFDTSKTILLANVASNPEWTLNWKGPIAFYVNWDNIGTAHVLSRAANHYEVIPASSNVSNAQVVFASQILNPSWQLLLGYDYSWEEDDSYYAGQDSIKRHYMHHVDAISIKNDMVKTSSNLLFSCNWLKQFLFKFKNTNVINCSERGILDIPARLPLEEALKGLIKEDS